MTSPTTDRRLGLLGSTGFKAPVTVLAIGNIVQSGEQTIDGKALLAVNADGVPDRVACVGMTDATKNGIWDVSTTAWTRSLDANQNYDLKKGTTVLITDGNTYAGTYWNITAANPITLGTRLITWARALANSISTLSFLQAGAGAVARGAQDKMREFVSLKDFGAVGDGATDDTAAIAAWLLVLGKTVADGGGAYGFAPPGVFKFNGALAVPACVIQGAGMHTTVFKAGNAAAQWVVSATAGYDESQGANASFSDFTIDGNGVANQSLLKFNVMNFPHVRSIALRNSVGIGLELSGTQNGLFECCDIIGHSVKNIAITDGLYLGSPTGADGNLFLKCEIASYGLYALHQSGLSFNTALQDCGIEFSTATSVAGVYLNQTGGSETALFIRGGFTNASHAIPVCHLVNGTLNFSEGQCYGATVATSLFYLNGPGTLLKLAGNCNLSGATNLFFVHNAGAFVYDLANYFDGFGANTFGTDVGAVRDSVVSRPLNSQLLLRRGQVKFPAVQVPSSDANVLDDYEEGTFVPAILSNASAAGITMTTQTGTYVKVGRLVFVTINVAAAVAGPSAGVVTISGLPITPGSANPGTLAIGSFSGLSAGSVISSQVQANPSTSISLFTQNNGAAQAGNKTMANTDLGANVSFVLSGTYLAQN